MPDTPEGLEAAFRRMRLVLDLKEVDVQLLAQVAEYRNALAKAENLHFEGGAWSRKSFAESIIEAAAKELRKSLAPMIQACGELPEIDLSKAGDKKERARFRKTMAEYIKRVVAWKARQEKK